MTFWDEKEPRMLFKELPFYETLIEKAYIKRLNNIDMLRELPICDELKIVKTSEVLKYMQEVIALKL